jgi:hypothetical protein
MGCKLGVEVGPGYNMELTLTMVFATVPIISKK